jgi:hypothetical protein
MENFLGLGGGSSLFDRNIFQRTVFGTSNKIPVPAIHGKLSLGRYRHIGLLMWMWGTVNICDHRSFKTFVNIEQQQNLLLVMLLLVSLCFCSTLGMFTVHQPCSFELISHGIAFFSHNKLANNTFQSDFSAKRTGRA